MSELKRPDDWGDEIGVNVLDPDGWRADGMSFETPITREEFMRRVVSSTCAWTKGALERLINESK